MDPSDIREILSRLARMERMIRILLNGKSIMKLQQAAEFFEMSPAKMRQECENGLPGAYPLNPESKKNTHWRINILKADEYFTNLRFNQNHQSHEHTIEKNQATEKLQPEKIHPE